MCRLRLHSHARLGCCFTLVKVVVSAVVSCSSRLLFPALNYSRQGSWSLLLLACQSCWSLLLHAFLVPQGCCFTLVKAAVVFCSSRLLFHARQSCCFLACQGCCFSLVKAASSSSRLLIPAASSSSRLLFFVRHGCCSF